MHYYPKQILSLALVCLTSAAIAEPAPQGSGNYGPPTSPGGNGGNGYGTPTTGGGGGGYGSPASGSGGGTGGVYGQQEQYPPRPYSFNYAVNDHYSGANFGQQEQSDGQKVNGQYRVLLPDGRTQVVTYNADWRNGFNADVKYQGEAQPYQPQGGGGGGGYSPTSGGNRGYASAPTGPTASSNGGGGGYVNSGGGSGSPVPSPAYSPNGGSNGGRGGYGK